MNFDNMISLITANGFLISVFSFLAVIIGIWYKVYRARQAKRANDISETKLNSDLQEAQPDVSISARIEKGAFPKDSDSEFKVIATIFNGGSKNITILEVTLFAQHKNEDGGDVAFELPEYEMTKEPCIVKAGENHSVTLTLTAFKDLTSGRFSYEVGALVKTGTFKYYEKSKRKTGWVW
ncbi:MAG: hypothetical protein HLX50_14020 [Alteromonadaceae bacterium]|nr:hypothetical protein [Alteromonadaceae bacterium]